MVSNPYEHHTESDYIDDLGGTVAHQLNTILWFQDELERKDLQLEEQRIMIGKLLIELEMHD